MMSFNQKGQTKKLLKFLKSIENPCCDCPDISKSEGNIIECRNDGLYVPTSEALRFGVVGEDDVAGEDRIFDLAGFDLSFANVIQDDISPKILALDNNNNLKYIADTNYFKQGGDTRTVPSILGTLNNQPFTIQVDSMPRMVFADSASNYNVTFYSPFLAIGSDPTFSQFTIINAPAQTAPIFKVFADDAVTRLFEIRIPTLQNIFFGVDAGLITTGSHNIGIGANTLKANTTGVRNIALGFDALVNATTATYNTALGANALRANTTGSNNTAIAPDAMFANTTGSNNAAIAALQANTTGVSNTALGPDALNQNVTGSRNVAVGHNAGRQSKGNNNTFIGYEAGFTSSATNTGNVFIGYQAGRSETGDNMLYIANSSTSTPLIKGVLSGIPSLTINGTLGIGVASIGATVHIKAGTATAGTAPLKLTSGVVLTTAEPGAFEYNGTNLFFTRTGTARESIITANAVNAVSPTAPDRTITVVIDGTTYYIHAKTTND